MWFTRVSINHPVVATMMLVAFVPELALFLPRVTGAL